MNAKQISQQFYKQNQSWHYENILDCDGKKLKVHIRRNAYDKQSYLHGYIFDPVASKWNLIVSRPIEGANCESVSYTDRKEVVNEGLFVEDSNSIIEELKEIIA